MPSLLKHLARLLTFDLTGRTWERQSNHPYFGDMTYFGSRNQAGCYWEAEISLQNTSTRIGVNMNGTPEGPTQEEERFCRKTLADLDALFELCRSAFEPEFRTWAKRPMPSSWKETFRLDGIQIPRYGDPTNPWEVCYFVEPVGHYFVAQFESGKVQHVAVDG